MTRRVFPPNEYANMEFAIVTYEFTDFSDDTDQTFWFETKIGGGRSFLHRSGCAAARFTRQQRVGGGGGVSTPSKGLSSPGPDDCGAIIDQLTIAIRSINFSAKKLIGKDRRRLYDAKIALCKAAAIVGGTSGHVRVHRQCGHEEPMLVVSLRGNTERYNPHLPERIAPPEIVDLLIG